VLVLALLVSDTRMTNRDVFLARASLGLSPIPEPESGGEQEEDVLFDSIAFRREMASIEAKSKREQSDSGWE
jgi:hypothetical protein